MARDALVAMVLEGAAPDPDYLDGIAGLATDASLDPAFRALCLRLPDEDDLAQAIADRGTPPDPLAIYAAREAMTQAVARQLGTAAATLYGEMDVPSPYSPDAEAAGKRALQAAMLGLITRTDGGALAMGQFELADNMTQSIVALSALVQQGSGDAPLAAFEARWRDDRLVMDKWFGLQASLAPPATAVATAQALAERPDFDWKNPNRFRALVGGLAVNRAGFHDPTGAGYDFVADWLIRLDPVNPQTTARMTTIFETWRRYGDGRQGLIRAQLERLVAREGCSKDMGEIAGRILSA